MAANDQTILKVNLLPDNQDASVALTSSSPNLDAFVEKIVAYKDDIDVEKINVMCDDEKFDTNNFKEIVTTSIKDFLEAIDLEQEKFDEVIAGLEEEQVGEEQAKEGQVDA